MMRTSYTCETPPWLALLSVCTSAAGTLCLSLSGLLPWPAFIPLAGVHLLVWLRYFDRELIGTRTALGIMVALAAIEGWRVSLSGGDAVVPALRDLIVVISLTRLLMRKTPREMYQITGISFSQCMLATIFTTSPLFLVGLGLVIVLVPMTLSALDAHAFNSPAGMRTDPAHWTAVTLGIVLATGILFYILPRPASSIITHSFVQDRRYTFSDNVDLKSSGRTSSDSSIVMRIIWSSRSAPAAIYLSGARLEGITMDGFFRLETAGSSPPVAGRVTDRLTVYPAAFQSEHVFIPFWFKDSSPRRTFFKGPNLYWSGAMPARYDLWVSRIPGPSPPGETYVPDGLLPVADLGVRISGRGAPAVRVERLARYLGTNYRYTLKPQDIPPGRHGIETFVFASRGGTCEHFASALATMIRGCGIPARVVTGFLVTEYNDVGNYYIVRASDAHAWVEYWDGSWHTVDATPAGRMPRGLRFHLLDELRFRWIRWVIEYSLDDQIRLAFSILSTAPQVTRNVDKAAPYALGAMGLVVLFLALFSVIRRSMRSPYEKVSGAFGKKGIHLPSKSAHEEHLSLVQGKDPELAAEFRKYLDDYLPWRFGSKEIDIDASTRRMIDVILRTGKMESQ